MEAFQGRIRHAHPEEAKTITDMVVRSKAYWGYDAQFMANVLQFLIIDAQYIQDMDTFVAILEEKIVGVVTLAPLDSEDVEIDHLFVDPSAIGKGVGKALWQYALRSVRSKNFKRIFLIADPNAERFYIHMGAVRIGDEPSSAIEGRKLPLMRYDL